MWDHHFYATTNPKQNKLKCFMLTRPKDWLVERQKFSL